MQKARLANGDLILAHQYNKEAHAGELLCADPQCGAHMVFRRETLTHGAAAKRDALFASKDVKEHREHCTAHEDFRILTRGKDNIEQGLAKGKTIVLNLNMQLTETFNGVARNLVCQPSTLEKGNYVTASAKSVEDLLDYLDTIKEKGGELVLARTVVNYQGHTMPVKEFVIETHAQYSDLLDKIYAAVDRARPGADVKGYPRLIRFKATQNTKKRETGAIRGTPMTIAKNNGNRVLMLQRAEVPKEFDKTLRGENVHVLAIPYLPYNEAKGVIDQLQRSANATVYLNLRWKVVGAHQFTPMPPEPEAPKPQQELFKPT